MEYTVEEGKRVINQIAALQASVFVLTCGDPIKRPGLFEFISHTRAQTAGLFISALSPRIF